MDRSLSENGNTIFLCVCVNGHSDYMIRTKNTL